jgi:hypothetical protein
VTWLDAVAAIYLLPEWVGPALIVTGGAIAAAYMWRWWGQR